jgi:hypothetical protein
MNKIIYSISSIIFFSTFSYAFEVVNEIPAGNGQNYRGYVNFELREEPLANELPIHSLYRNHRLAPNSRDDVSLAAVEDDNKHSGTRIMVRALIYTGHANPAPLLRELVCGPVRNQQTLTFREVGEGEYTCVLNPH